MSSTELASAYRSCERITWQRAKNFAYALLLVPCAIRRPVAALYSFCRDCDDAVDGNEPLGEKHARLAALGQRLQACYDGARVEGRDLALRDTIRRHRIPQQYFLDLLGGVRMDLHTRRYRTFHELRQYCYGVASTVGLMCIEVFGYRDTVAREHAVELGLAMQLTNILRDIAEDAERDRIYLPLDEIEACGYSESQLLRGERTPEFRNLMLLQARRIRAYFLRSEPLFPMLRPRARPCPRILRALYMRLLHHIERDDFNVFGRRIGLPTGEKIWLATQHWLQSFFPAP